ncbi:MFS transporter [Phreatobacter stygius]|uniref:MFS transporter n=2 Tax=Phreatobacter stygius TaxID=1940610 RepID=A0A4D7BF64_9HYPH|nr:MFS transporter [Phreatobacter stygius]
MTASTEGPVRTRRGETSLLVHVSMAHLVSHFHIMTLPALIPLLPGYLGVSFVEVGVALAVFNLVSLVVQTPIGFLTDRFGARRMLVGGLMLGSASFLSVALFDSYPWLLVAMAAAGFANGVYHPADYALLSSGIDEDRMGRAFSIHTFAGFLGTAIAPAVLLGIASLTSVKMAFATAGLLGLAVAALLLTGSSRPSAAKSRVPASPAGGRSGLFTPAVMTLTALFMLLNLSTAGIQNFSVAAFVAGYGVDLALANLALTVFLFSSAFGVLAGGTLADRTSRHGHLTAGAFLATALLVSIIALVRLPPVALVLLMAAAGFLSGVITPSRDMLVRAAAPPGAEGRVFGIVSTGFNIGGAVGPLLFAGLLDHGYPQGVFGTAVVFMLLTVALALYQERGRTTR